MNFIACLRDKSGIWLVDQSLLIYFNKVTELSVAIDYLFIWIRYEEKHSLWDLDLDLLFNDPKGVLGLLIFLVQKVKYSDFKGFVEVLEVIAELLVLVNVEVIGLFNLCDLFAYVEDKG